MTATGQRATFTVPIPLPGGGFVYFTLFRMRQIEWDRLMLILEAMKPGLVQHQTPAVFEGIGL